jgi:UDP-2,3-diacylglucosamine hydrolase
VSERTLIVADAHLGSTPGDIGAFIEFLERESGGARPERLARLVLLGDLFDLWLGLPSLQTEGQRRVTAALHGLRGRGVRLWYVEGNRDYFIASAFARRFFEQVGEEGLDLEVAGARVRFEHGDRINVADRSYQRWRRFSRAPLVRAAFAAIPARPAGRLAHWLERRFRTSNMEHRARFPEELCRQRALRVFETGVRRLFLGHFHCGWDWTAEIGGRSCRVVVVPAWQEARAGWVLDPERGEDGLTPAVARSTGG